MHLVHLIKESNRGSASAHARETIRATVETMGPGKQQRKSPRVYGKSTWSAATRGKPAQTVKEYQSPRKANVVCQGIQRDNWRKELTLGSATPRTSKGIEGRVESAPGRVRQSEKE